MNFNWVSLPCQASYQESLIDVKNQVHKVLYGTPSAKYVKESLFLSFSQLIYSQSSLNCDS